MFCANLKKMKNNKILLIELENYLKKKYLGEKKKIPKISKIYNKYPKFCNNSGTNFA
jgi:hypothetical protein